MNGSLVVFVVWFALVIIVGIALTVRARNYKPARWWINFSGRVDDSVEVSSSRLGSFTLAALVYFAGAGLIIAILWPLGLLAHALEDQIDKPLFYWFQDRQLDYWSDIWLKLTNIGKPRITQGIDAVAAVVFAVVWAIKGLRWWAPPVVFASAYALEKYVQFILQAMVDRGHPPTTLGTWPSGGCARVTIIYGLIIFCTIYVTRRQSRQAWIAGWSLLAILMSIQAYARTYNLEHWITDVVAGILFGLLGLVVMTSFLRLLTEPNAPRAPTGESSCRATRASAADGPAGRRAGRRGCGSAPRAAPAPRPASAGSAVSCAARCSAGSTA